MNSRSVKPIDVMIIGAEKSGTTSLVRYVGSHPQVCTHDKREMNYFVNDEEFEAGYPAAYARYFSPCTDTGIRIIAKSVAVSGNPTAVQRLHAHNPDVHLVMVLRNSIDRAYSAYWHAKRRGWEDAADFETAIERELSAECDESREGNDGTTYLRKGIYADQIAALQVIFSPRQVHVFTFDELKENPLSICRALFSVIGVDESFEPDVSVRFNKAAQARSPQLAKVLSYRGKIKKIIRRLLPRRVSDRLKQRLVAWNEKPLQTPAMKAATRRRLEAYFNPHNKRLEALTGRPFNW
ncbi:MAG: hypothetical protein DIZ77_05430 [endosymbiont of Seepiophila jonesi]|uniref:Sulfotransferase domain-containing protein n=1 Tax=endosymbiont of Lamellibrachia luymesi TaxID=2200907 RepID=A0A370DUE2_9GAMM|nr:MAG: hypothetical protein DIZ79_13825 [endosymbiont of Lamellibrachia luymesi]RDH93638.1 MAG: hypothetical protein DIZ77_05430 [endosymbiont of Seepiophila jonesi]